MYLKRVARTERDEAKQRVQAWSLLLVQGKRLNSPEIRVISRVVGGNLLLHETR